MKAWRIAAILAAGAVLGLGWNAAWGRGLELSRNVLVQEGDDVVSVEEAHRRWSQGVLFLDARPRMFFEMEHVPGALPLPEDEFDAAFAELEPRLRDQLDVVVYCSGFGCEASHIVARRLHEHGIPAAVLHDGWPAWTDAGYPIEEPGAP